jgi:hypothetical protein
MMPNACSWRRRFGAGTPPRAPANEARRLTEKLEIHFIPEFGSWLNMAEARPT